VIHPAAPIAPFHLISQAVGPFRMPRKPQTNIHTVRMGQLVASF
jgi:hypothetical protein